MDPKRQAVIEVLNEACHLLARHSIDFSWSSWEDADAALAELKDLIGRLQAGHILNRTNVEVLFAPTGPIQELSLSSGWAHEFLRLADSFDVAIRNLYGDAQLS